MFPNLFLLVFPTGNLLTSIQGSAGIVLGTGWTALALGVLYPSEIHDNLSLWQGVCDAFMDEKPAQRPSPSS